MTVRPGGTLLAAVGLALGAWSCAHDEPYDKPHTPVRVEQVGDAAGSGGTLRYSAAIVPTHAVPVAFKVPGYISAIATVADGAGGRRLLQEGDRVRQGEMLAQIRTDDFTVKLNAARSQLAEVEAALAQARQAYERAAVLYENKSLTRTDYDAAKAAYEGVQARREGARALVNEAENAVADATLKSPVDGTVIKRRIEVGALVGPGTPGFVVADTSTVKVLFGAPDPVVRRLARNQRQSISTETFPNERFEGRITSLAPAADPGSLVFDVEVTIPNPDGRLKPGMVASIEIPGETGGARMALPLSAVVRAPGKPDGYAVYVIEQRDGAPHARLRQVSLGPMISNGVAVTAGLRPGEQVIVTGATIVADGERVEVLR